MQRTKSIQAKSIRLSKSLSKYDEIYKGLATFTFLEQLNKRPVFSLLRGSQDI